MPMPTAYHDKRQKELSEHIRKATNDLEVAPKRKHVRWVILFAWDHVKSMSSSTYSYSTQPIWTALKGQPILSHEIMCFKALILVHSLLVEGPQMVLSDALREIPFLEECVRRFEYSGSRGYDGLIKTYVQYLKAKLEFHRLYPLFNGVFDYDEYVKNKTVTNLDDGYQSIQDLVVLMDHLDRLQRLIIKQFRYGSDNECRQAALIPLVLESNGMYKFMTQLLGSLLDAVDSIEALIPLQKGYDESYRHLKIFYDEARRMQYLTSIITVPKLPDRAVFSFDDDRRKQKKASSNMDHNNRKESIASVRPPIVEDVLIDLGGPTDQEVYYIDPAYQTEYGTDIYGVNQPQQYYEEVQGLQPPETAHYDNSQNVQYLTNNLHLMQINNHSINGSMSQPSISEIPFDPDLDKKYAELLSQYNALLAKYQSLQQEHSLCEESLSEIPLLQSQLSEMNLLKAQLQEMNAIKSQLNELNRHLRNLSKENETLQRSLDQSKNALSEERMRSQMALLDLKKKHDQASSQNQLQAEKERLSEISLLYAPYCKRLTEAVQFYDSSSTPQDVWSIEQTLSLLDDSISHGEALLSNLTNVLNMPSDMNHVSHSLVASDAVTTHLEHLLLAAKYLHISGIIETENVNPKLACIDGIALFGNRLLDALLNGRSSLSFDLVLYLQQFQSYLKEILMAAPINTHPDPFTLTSSRESNQSKDDLEPNSTNLADEVHREMNAAAECVKFIGSQIHLLMQNASTEVNEWLMNSSLRITDAVALLIKYAIQCQYEIIEKEQSDRIESGVDISGSFHPDLFYKRHSRWTEGLISAAKAVALAMSMLFETAEKISDKTGSREYPQISASLEQVIAVSREVAASTAQLVAASRVKVIPFSKYQSLLEDASKQVIMETKGIVKEAQQHQHATNRPKMPDSIDINQLSTLSQDELTTLERSQRVKIIILEESLEKAFASLHQTRQDPTIDSHSKNIVEMNNQIQIQSLQKDLLQAREQLSLIRRSSYQL